MDFGPKARETGRVETKGKPTFRDYTRLLADRPPKFSAEQVDYRNANGQHGECDACIHFYKSEAAEREVCEIFRPDGDESVNPHWTCDWWTDDGVRFPLLKENK